MEVERLKRQRRGSSPGSQLMFCAFFLSLIGWNLGERLRVVLYSLALPGSLRVSAIKLRPHAGNVRLSLARQSSRTSLQQRLPVGRWLNGRSGDRPEGQRK